MAENKCRTCKWFATTECRRRSPIHGPLDHNGREFPSVHPGDWCGDWESEEEQPRLIPDSEVPEPDMVKEGHDPRLGFLDWVRERFKRKHEYKPPREPSEPWPDPPQGYQPKTGLDQGNPPQGGSGVSPAPPPGPKARIIYEGKGRI